SSSLAHTLYSSLFNLLTPLILLFFKLSGAHRDLHSFPTRRSSDLLRQPSEHRAPEEEAEAKKIGLRYFNIPVVYAEPKDEQVDRSEEHTSELQSLTNLVCRLLLEKKKKKQQRSKK